MKISKILLTCMILASGLTTAQAQTTYYWDRNDGNPGGLNPTTFGDGTWDTTSANWNTNSDGSGANTVWANPAPVPGDFNNNGTADAADYVVWRKNGEPNTPGTGALTNDGGAADQNARLALWKANFGNVGGTANDAVFSAGTDVQGVGTPAFPFDAGVAISGTMTARTLTIEEGWVKFTSASLAIGIGASDPQNIVTVKNGATLEITNVLNVNTLKGGFAGHNDAVPPITTLDGGTLRNSIVGAGSQFWGPVTTSPTPTNVHSSRIELTSNGGTVDTPSGAVGGIPDDINGAYSIMQYSSDVPAGSGHTSIIAMSPGTTSATLHKKGHGEFRASRDWTFTTLDVQQGLYRILNTGNDTGFGAVTGTVMVAGGAVENTTNGTALGTTANLTSAGAGPSPTTRSFVLTGTGDTLDSMIVTNANWTILGNISGAGGLMLNGWKRNDTGAIIGIESQLTLGGTNTYAGKTTINFGTIIAQNGSAIPNTSRVEIATRSVWGATTLNTATLRVDNSETIGSLASGPNGATPTRGSVNINGAGVTLTTGADGTSSTYSGAITGAGDLAKSGGGTFTMDGAKSYTGNTAVLAGVLSTNSASLADAADVLLTTGGVFDLNFAGTDIIDQLFFDGLSQAVGTWGGAGSGATNISSFFTGTGTLTISNPGSGLGGGAVPEPTAAVLLMLGIAAFVGGRRGR